MPRFAHFRVLRCGGHPVSARAEGRGNETWKRRSTNPYSAFYTILYFSLLFGYIRFHCFQEGIKPYISRVLTATDLETNRQQTWKQTRFFYRLMPIRRGCDGICKFVSTGSFPSIRRLISFRTTKKRPSAAFLIITLPSHTRPCTC